MSRQQYNNLMGTILNEKCTLTKLRAELEKRKRKICFEYVTNFIWPYLHQFFDDSHGLRSYGKPSKRPFDRCQSCLKAINIGQDIKQINW